MKIGSERFVKIGFERFVKIGSEEFVKIGCERFVKIGSERFVLLLQALYETTFTGELKLCDLLRVKIALVKPV